MTRWADRLASAAVLCGLVASPTIAQDVPSQDQVLRLASLPLQSVVRLRTFDHGRLQGRLVSVDRIAVHLTQPTGSVLILRRVIERAELRRGTRLLHGSLLGGAIGAGAGFAIAYLFAPYRSTDFSRVGLAGLVGTMSGLGGVVVGGILGATVRAWVRVAP